MIFFKLRKSFYINNIIYYIAAAAAVVFVASYFLPPWFRIGVLILILLGLALVVDTLLIYSIKNGVKAERWLPDRFSMGDDNKVILLFQNHYHFPANISVIDELPAQFQERKWLRKLRMETKGKSMLEYKLRPVTRGEYVFHDINVYVQAPLGLVKRRYIFPAQHKI